MSLFNKALLGIITTVTIFISRTKQTKLDSRDQATSLVHRILKTNKNTANKQKKRQHSRGRFNTTQRWSPLLISTHMTAVLITLIQLYDQLRHSQQEPQKLTLSDSEQILTAKSSFLNDYLHKPLGLMRKSYKNVPCICSIT